MYHANRWLTDPGSLRFLVDGECFGNNQTSSSLCLAGVAGNNEIKIDCFLPQGGSCRAHHQRLPSPLPSGTKQPQIPPPPPEPPSRRASSSSDHHSYYSDNIGCFSEWSSSWSNEDSHYSSGPRGDGSWEGDSFCDGYPHSYGSCDSDYDSVSIEQSVREYMDHKSFASNKDNDSIEDPG